MYFKFPDTVPDEIVEALGGDKALATWFFEEWKVRVQERRARGIEAQKQLSILNAKVGHRPVDGLGQCVFRIQPLLRASIADEFGWEAALDDQFCKELVRDNDWMCFVPSYEKKPMIVKLRDVVGPLPPLPPAAAAALEVPKPAPVPVRSPIILPQEMAA